MSLRSCLNWKVLLGLSGAAVLVMIIAPHAAGIVPLLAVLACPLSMGVMMWSMRAAPSSDRAALGSRGSEERIAELEAQIADLHADRAGAERISDHARTR